MMGSTGDADRKRRHFGSASPTAAPAKKQPFSPISEDKKVIASRKHSGLLCCALALEGCHVAFF